MDAGQEEGSPEEPESMGLLRCLESPQRSLEKTAPKNTQVNLFSESGCSVQRVDYFHTDTTELEELFDSSGAEVPNNRPTLTPLDKGATTTSGKKLETLSLVPHEVSHQLRYPSL